MKLILIKTFCWLQLAVNAQNFIEYHKECNIAVNMIEQGQFEIAKDVLLSAFETVDGDVYPIDLFNLAKCYSQLGDRENALKYLELSLQKDKLKQFAEIHHLWFEPILGSKQWNQIKDSTYYIVNKKNDFWKTEFREKLGELTQEFHQLELEYYDSIIIYYPHDTTLLNNYKDSLNQLFQPAQKYLTRVIETRGIPDYRTNKSAHLWIFTCLYHFNPETLKKISSIAKSFIKNGDVPPWTYAYIIDRLAEHEEKESVYGFHNHFDQPTPEMIHNAEAIGFPMDAAFTVRIMHKIPEYE